MRIIIALLALAGAGYLAAAVYIKINETSLVYHPGERIIQSPDSALGIAPRKVSFASADGTKLVGWLIFAPGSDSATGAWVLDCHGNAGNISSYGRPRWAAWMRQQGMNVFQFDYRGFGESAGSPTERGLYSDAEAAYQYLIDSLGVLPERLVIYGHSLGSGVATHLASKVRAAGLIVEGAFTAVADRGQELYPWLPVRLLSSNDFDSIGRIRGIATPKLFIHATDDEIIPYAHGQRLYDAAVTPKSFLTVSGGHERAFEVDREKYYAAIRAFADTVTGRFAVPNAKAY
ncbi:MAG TPA: alpha/beta hydrolase [Gemmatimonadaceae bacterium]|nr:alpha/beta hydrolase [Gemmatimonadaceae bacterium]